MVSELKDHLLRHLQGVEKKKIEQVALDYVSKLVGFVLFFFTPWPLIYSFQYVVKYVFQIRFLEFSHPQTSIFGVMA